MRIYRESSFLTKDTVFEKYRYSRFRIEYEGKTIFMKWYRDLDLDNYSHKYL